VGQRVERDTRQRAAAHERRQHGAQHRELDALHATFPRAGGKHGHTVDDHDPPERRLQAGVEERGQARSHRGPRILLGQRRGHHRPCGLVEHHVVDRLEQRVLAAEVVVESAFRDAGPLHDVVHRGRRVALLGEPLARDCDQQLPGGLRLPFAQPLDSHPVKLRD